LDAKSLPITFHLHKIPKLLTMAHKLKDVKDLASQVIFPRFY
jgi:hypothetical protein